MATEMASTSVHLWLRGFIVMELESSRMAWPCTSQLVKHYKGMVLHVGGTVYMILYVTWLSRSLAYNEVTFYFSL